MTVLTGPMVVVLATSSAVICTVVRAEPLAAPPTVVLVAICGAVAACRARFGWTLVAVVLAATAVHAVRAQPEAEAIPAEASRIAGRATLVDDPRSRPGATVVLAEVEDVRYELRAHGSARRAMAPMLAGETVAVRGTVRALPEWAGWLRDRHVVARLHVETVEDWDPGGVVVRATNRFRQLLRRGAVSLDEDARGLFAGLVLGDRREQGPLVADAFAAAGLTHLTAVSGQNVAFVLAVLAPLLGRVGRRSRLAGVLGALGFFALVTRLEPSVLRAVTMAGLAALATGLGRSTTGLRNLGLAVAGLLLVDPLLSGRPAFVLSVVASAGILVGGTRLAGLLPGPRSMAGAVGVTLSAQLATGPVLAALFGGVPLAGIPANLLAGPAAGLVMMYGLTGGVVAGVAATFGWGSVAALVHLPTRVLVGWVLWVADGFATIDTVPLSVPSSLALAAGTLVAAAALQHRRRPLPPRGRGRSGRLLGVLAASAVVLPCLYHATEPHRAGEPVRGEALATGAHLWRAGGALVGRAGLVVLDGRVRTEDLLAALRARRIRSIELVVARSNARGAVAAIDALDRRFEVIEVLAPDGAGEQPPERRDVAGLVVHLRAGSSSWEVDVEG